MVIIPITKNRKVSITSQCVCMCVSVLTACLIQLIDKFYPRCWDTHKKDFLWTHFSTSECSHLLNWNNNRSVSNSHDEV